MKWESAVTAAKELATRELNSPCRKFTEREGTRYHSGRSDWEYFYCNDTHVQVIHLHVEPNGYSVQAGMRYEKEQS